MKEHPCEEWGKGFPRKDGVRTMWAWTETCKTRDQKYVFLFLDCFSRVSIIETRVWSLRSPSMNLTFTGWTIPSGHWQWIVWNGQRLLLCEPQNYFYPLMHQFTWKTTASTNCVPNTIIGILLNKSDPIPIHRVYSKRAYNKMHNSEVWWVSWRKWQVTIIEQFPGKAFVREWYLSIEIKDEWSAVWKIGKEVSRKIEYKLGRPWNGKDLFGMMRNSKVANGAIL